VQWVYRKKSASSYHCAETRYGCAQHGFDELRHLFSQDKRVLSRFRFSKSFGEINLFREDERAGTVPEMEVFDNGHINNAMPLIDMGI